MFSLHCGHVFCRPCYRQYLLSMVADGPVCILGTCPELKCKQRVTGTAIQQLLLPRSVSQPVSLTNISILHFILDATGTGTY